jgi:N6-L-threonylcarbamoyladenine synthase
VNHVHAHIFGALMPAMAERAAAGLPVEPEWPLASLVVSGGHTSLYCSREPAEHERVGRTIDDAAGEAYDKVAALLGLSYPGGPVIDKLAQRGNPRAHAFPRSRPPGLDFSFSGLKTAVLYAARGPNAPRGAPLLPGARPEDLAASFQAAVVDVLVERLLQCAERIGARGLTISGGVAANSALRAQAAEAARKAGLPLDVPPLALATDNAVMIAGLGHWLFRAGRTGDLLLDVAARAD